MSESLVNGDGQNGPTLATLNTSISTPLAGFTAVNGFTPISKPVRPEDTGQLSVKPPDIVLAAQKAIEVPPSPDFLLASWRPDTRPHTDTDDTIRVKTPTKRKWSKTGEAETQSVGENVDNVESAQRSPKRGKTMDSAIDLSGAEAVTHHVELPPAALPPEPAPIGPYQRERSPVARGELPPKPRPETEAILAASLQQFQQNQQQETRQAEQERLSQAREASPPEDSPPDDAEEQHDSQLIDDDQLDADDYDSKKRKRNFSNRTKTGCHTCRSRKKKCDEGKPTCQNCERSGHPCAGYGPKPPGGAKVPGQTRTAVAIQSKSAGTGARQDEGRSYSHWGRVTSVASEPDPPRQYAPVAPQAAEQRRPTTGDSWQQQQQKPMWGPTDATPPYQYQSMPPPSFPPNPPPGYMLDPRTPQPHPQPHQHQQQQPPLPPPPPLQPQYHYQGHLQHPPPLPPPPPQMPTPMPMPTSMEPYNQFPFGSTPPYQQRLGPPTVLSSSDSSGSHRSGPLAPGYPGSTQQMEKDKMLRGQPYLHWLDSVLINDRQDCRAAFERYNKATESTSGISTNERTKLFAQILEPAKRPESHARERHQGPTGAIGEHTVVESPFKCDYGYNIHLANECIVEAGCYMQDAADIAIGNRVVIGNNAKFYTMAPSLNTNVRKGARGRVSAGAIKVEDDVFIGADATILPYVTIGRGSVVGAGSVVTRDVKKNTVVAGNPAKPKRKIQGDMTQHLSEDIQDQEEKMKQWMTEYARSGFSLHRSPRF